MLCDFIGVISKMAEENNSSGPIVPFLPEVKDLFTDPIDPSIEMTPQDRWNLVKQSQRGWGEFFDISKFNLSPIEQLNQRVKQNIITYFYNYFIIAVIHILLYSLLHFKTLVGFIFIGGLCMLKDRIVENMDSSKEDLLKVVVGIIAVFVFFWAHGFALLFSILIFNFLFIGIHSAVRDYTDDDIVEI